MFHDFQDINVSCYCRIHITLLALPLHFPHFPSPLRSWWFALMVSVNAPLQKYKKFHISCVRAGMAFGINNKHIQLYTYWV